jgi:hypothetical protein
MARPLREEQLIREAVLLTFCEPPPPQCLRLQRLSVRQWQKLLTWLDISGLALYFLDRLIELGQLEILPPAVAERLQQNLLDNTERMLDMGAESSAIQREFQSAELTYALLKGSSLWPSSVPRQELRSQLDLDFLISEASAPAARRILESRGYHLHALSGRTWEFKKGPIPRASLKNLYKVVPHRCVELHLEPNVSERPSLLARAQRRSLNGISTPVLAPTDLFIGQGLHLYKHVCSSFSRTAHLLEFRRHLLARHDDALFWSELQSAAQDDIKTSLALGVATHLITHVMGDVAPQGLTRWTVDRLPPSAKLWVEIYGRGSVFADFPGSKFYLLLQRELEGAGIPVQRSLRRTLLPLRLPPAISHAPAMETLHERAVRYHAQCRFILFRLRFHVVEGLRFARESLRWRQHMNGLAR